MRAEDMMQDATPPAPKAKGKPKKAKDRMMRPRNDKGGESAFNLTLGLVFDRLAKYAKGPHPDGRLVQADFRVGECREICQAIKHWREG